MMETLEAIGLNTPFDWSGVSTTVLRLSPSSVSFLSLMEGQGDLDRRRWRAMEKYYSHLMDRLARSAGDWLVVNSAREKQLYDKYNRVIDLLIKKKVIEAKNGGKFRFSKDKARADDGYCRSYRLRNEHLMTAPVPSLDTVDVGLLEKRSERKQLDQPKKQRLTRLRYLDKLVGEIEVDYKGCEEELVREPGELTAMVKRYQAMVDAGAQPEELAGLLGEITTFGMSEGEVESLFRFLHDSQEHRHNLKRSRTCARLTAIYTQCASRWRRFWKWKGIPLVGDDISSCHAVFWINRFASGDEKAELIAGYEKGQFYELFMDGKHSRGYIKEQFQTWMNGDRYSLSKKSVNGAYRTVKKKHEFGSHPLDNIVGAVFPNFARSVRSIEIYGKTRRSRFACANMKSEAAIMIDAMLEWAKDNDVVYYPIHDGWLTIPDHREMIRDQVRTFWKKWTGITPFINAAN